jgi:hypothetical protein
MYFNNAVRNNKIVDALYSSSDMRVVHVGLPVLELLPKYWITIPLVNPVCSIT